MDDKDKIINFLLKVISEYHGEAELKESPIAEEWIGNVLYKTALCTKGERDKGIPDYQGSMYTYIFTEGYVDEELIYASMDYCEEH